MDKRQQYYSALDKLFDQIGWDLFKDDLQQQIDNAKDGLSAVTDLRSLGYLQGRLGFAAEILAFEDTIRSQIADLAEDNDADIQL